MNRVISLVVVLILLLSPTALAKNEVEINDTDSKNQYVVTSHNNKIKSENKDKLQKIKTDSDFEVKYEDEAGNFLVVPSNKIKTQSDYSRFQSKLNEFSAQGTKTVKGSKATSSRGEFLVQKFTDTVWDSDNWFGDEEIKVNGNGFTAWCLDSDCLMSGPTVNFWTSLQSQVDSFTFNYSYVSSTSSGVIISPTPSVNTTWTVSNTSSTYSINWPNIGQGNYAYRTYGEVYLKTSDVTGYTHTSSAVSSSPATGAINIIANEYVGIS